MRFNRHVVLLGFMGVGKSTIGRLLARVLRVPFIDLDQAIEASTHLSISEYFEQHGEAAFRILESKVLREVLEGPRAVVATGGGVLLSDENARLIHEKSIPVLLTATRETLIDRLKRERRKRPLLAGDDWIHQLDDLIKKREAIYKLIELKVRVDRKNPDVICKEIRRLVQSSVLFLSRGNS